MPIGNKLSWTFFPASDFVRISDKWQQLCNRSLRSPLLSSDFIEVALNHFARGDELICFAETATETVAAAILQRKNWLVWETFKPSQMPLGAWLQLLQTDFPEISQSLLRALPFPAMMLAVTYLDSRFLSRPKGKALLALDSFTTGEIDLPDTTVEFMQSLNSKVHKELGRRIRKAEKEIGPIEFITQTEAEKSEAFINIYASMESRSWKGETATALTSDDGQSKFYADLLRQFAITGRSRMFTLKIGARNVAAQIAIVDNETLYLLKTTYEADLRSLGPGVMQHYFISLNGYEQKQRVKRIELYGKLNESQQMWVTGSRSIYHVNTYRSSLLAKAHRYLINRQACNEKTSMSNQK
jgi:CelD/BcsL family acetyltransferase involved in cellulose biosynthesis